MQVTGIPPLEKQMDKKFSGRKDYEEYKANTSIFIPKP
jgi:steroid 5-alpha reductase family enzyme